MEISFVNKEVDIFSEVCHQVKRTQNSVESVVPDTNEDIGKIASVQTNVFLKSKDVTSRGVSIGGEFTASLLYITEDESKVEHLCLSRSFDIEFEQDFADKDVIAQVKLKVSDVETHVLNPRKVSLSFEIAAELSCYARESICVDSCLPEGECRHIHLQRELAQLSVVNAVCEKTFAVNEQYTFPSGKPLPSKLVYQSAKLNVNDSQLIGSKLVVKGSVNINACYLSDETDYPLKCEFSSPFSQIIDISAEEMESSIIAIELTSAYYNITDTIGGDKALNAELHAVMQIAGYSKLEIAYVSDAYSNLMPGNCVSRTQAIDLISSCQNLRLPFEERLMVSEDCEDVLWVSPRISEISAADSKLKASVSVDILYRSTGGMLAAVSRIVSAESACDSSSIRICDARLSELYLRPDGHCVDIRAAVDAVCVSASTKQISAVELIELDEEKVCDPSSYPSLTLVRVEDESLWELAKTYHSSCECIIAANALEGDVKGKLLLIPKSI